MPHIPDATHPTHDPELIAALAAGDATGLELERATALVAACADCAQLADDLRAIAAAVPAIPAPKRPRDFRLTAEDAASLQPRGLRGLLASLSGPRFAFATPLGTGVAALGIVGVLVASGATPLVGSSAPDEPLAMMVESAAPVPTPDEGRMPQDPADGDASMAPAQSPDTVPMAMGSPEPAESPQPEIAGGNGGAAGQVATGIDEPAGGTAVVTKTAGPDPLLVPATAAILLGMALVLVRGVARRLA